MRNPTPGAARPEREDFKSAEELLPLVYGELRNLAALRLRNEGPGQTLQPTALVHEAWVRLKGSQSRFANRSHFFAAAAEAMRWILIERARRRSVLEKGGFAHREEMSESKIIFTAEPGELLAVHEVLDQLEAEDSEAAQVVKLRYFVGLSMPETAEAMGVPLRSAERIWTYARAWLRDALGR